MKTNYTQELASLDAEISDLEKATPSDVYERIRLDGKLQRLKDERQSMRRRQHAKLHKGEK